MLDDSNTSWTRPSSSRSRSRANSLNASPSSSSSRSQQGYQLSCPNTSTFDLTSASNPSTTAISTERAAGRPRARSNTFSISDFPRYRKMIQGKDEGASSSRSKPMASIIEEENQAWSGGRRIQNEKMGRRFTLSA